MTNMKGLINLKRQKMTFEKKSLRVVVPLDLAEGECYTEPMRDEGSADKLDDIYHIIVKKLVLVHSTKYQVVAWECGSTCIVDSNEEIKRW